MVTATDHQRTVRALRSVEAALRDLPQVVAEWETLDDGEQMAWAIEWSDEMSKLESLARSATNGLLPAVQRDQFVRLVTLARALAPVMGQLSLYRPKVLMDD